MDDSDRLSALERALCARLGEERYDLWIGSRTELAVEGDVVRVRFASAAEMRFVRRRLDCVLADVVAEVCPAACEVSYEIIAKSATTAAPQTSPVAESRPIAAPARPAELFQRLESATAGALFDDFHVGPSNALAVQAAREAAAQPGRYTPLLVTGPIGCGKSHLLSSLGRRARVARPRLRVLALTAEQFTTQFLEALHRRDLPGFRHKTRSADLLLLDDVQFLVTKKATLGELVYTIDAIQSHGGQVALAADRPAGDLQAHGPELAARLSAGLSTAMQSPEFEVRRGIVRSLAIRMTLELFPSVVDLVAQQVVGGGRMLSGALNRLAAAGAAAGHAITPEFAARELEEFSRQHAPQVRLADIQRAVCEAFGVEPATLKSPRKDRGVAEPRMLAMWLSRRYTRAALSEIGDFFGRRSHSTVVSAQKKVDGLIGSSGQLRIGERSCHVEDAVRRVEAILRSG